MGSDGRGSAAELEEKEETNSPSSSKDLLLTQGHSHGGGGVFTSLPSFYPHTGTRNPKTQNMFYDANDIHGYGYVLGLEPSSPLLPL